MFKALLLGPLRLPGTELRVLVRSLCMISVEASAGLVALFVLREQNVWFRMTIIRSVLRPRWVERATRGGGVKGGELGGGSSKGRS